MAREAVTVAARAALLYAFQEADIAEQISAVIHASSLLHALRRH
ncbi:hypothetical protein [Streptomyces sp. NPDC007369]